MVNEVQIPMLASVSDPKLEFESLKRTRAGIRGRLTRLENWITNIDLDKEYSVEDFDPRIVHLTSVFDNFEDVQTKIEIISPDEQGQRERFEESYYDIHAMYTRMRNRFAPAPVVSQPGSVNENAGNSNTFSENFQPNRCTAAPSNSGIIPEIRLPPISIPVFDGSPEKFAAFKELFFSIVDQSPHLSDVAKFYYLRSSLSDKAATVISSISVTGEHYKLAWQLLTERFQCTGSIVDALNSEFLSIPAVSSDSAPALRKLLDSGIRIYRSLKSMGTIQTGFDSIFVTILLNKIDSDSRTQFKLSLPSVNHVPCFDELYTFLNRRIQAYECITTRKRDGNNRTVSAVQNSQYQPDTEGKNSRAFTCPLCTQPHRIHQCDVYKNMSIPERKSVIRDKRLCNSCLSPSHLVAKCLSRFRCRFCNLPHHSSIHVTPRTNQSSNNNTAPALGRNSTSPHRTVALFGTENDMTQVLLSTAQVLVYDCNCQPHVCRCLIDSAAQNNFVSKEFAQKLRLPLLKSHLKVTGIGRSQQLAAHRISARIKSRITNYSRILEFFILPCITEQLPSTYINTAHWDIPPSLPLADDHFNEPSEVDMLIGAQVFFEILYRCRLAANHRRPALQHTSLGWILGGPVPASTRSNFSAVHLSLSEQVERFWSIDECAHISRFSPDEEKCENHFLSTHTRDNTGRFTVRLPFKGDPATLGRSRSQARRRWISVESRLTRDDFLRKGYVDFMLNYLKLGHMVKLGSEFEFSEAPGQYYIPHHAVTKADSTSTKIRIVFDGSAKTTSGNSLNDLLLVGPTVQDELFEILLRFRKYRYVFIADIEKMYRQIWVEPSDRRFQLVFWREKPTDILNCYQLATVTYGTSHAPYAATRCLKQLAIDEAKNFPEAASVIHDFYVDDCISGHNDLNQALVIQQQLISRLATAGFPLRKWAANHPQLLESIPLDDRELLHSLHVTADEAVKTLGLIWMPNKDAFIYDGSKVSLMNAHTKRKVLSQLSSLFDPLGLLGPIITSAKIFMQQLWQAKVTWDETLPPDLIPRWSTFNQSLKNLADIQIPRLASSSTTPVSYQLHGFADASELAYGCAVYLLTTDTNKDTSVHLLCSKSRVSPIKPMTLPRLELAAALLLTRQMTVIIKALKLPSYQLYCWSDSQIVLSWLRASPLHWKTFVSNRVGEIQELNASWHHVPSEHNPADIISRGCSVEFLKQSVLWWKGPEFLKNPDQPWTHPETLPNLQDVPEKRIRKATAIVCQTDISSIFTRYSSVSRLIDVTAWCFRFSNNAHKVADAITGPLTILERDYALLKLVILAQKESFASDLQSLISKGRVSKKSKLSPLQPFLDNQGAIRVGGRLRNSVFNTNVKHPIILPAKHPLTILIVQREHIRCLHGGAQLVLSILRQRYWIVNGRQVIRQIIHKCVTCFRVKPRNSHPLMGQLPTLRTQPARPFYHTGVDFAGPFMLRPPTRSKFRLKYYVSVFVCMVTKATHLELVGDLSAETFIAALKRFIARRGLCHSISSDNATNFQGAQRQLKEVYAMLRSSKEKIAQSLAELHIQWHFIPPVTPHWGGLWEGAVKSTKGHLRRVAGMASLTYEEFSTILCSVEACLNSRPLTPLSSDPTDMNALTPGHFLIGAPLLAIPEQDLTQENISRLTRWHRVQSITQHFWKRWMGEYVATLLPLSKWKDISEPLIKGCLVIIKDEKLPPLQWKLGRIIDTHPGKDGITRVVSLNTASGTLTRNASRVFPLPIN